MFLTAVLLIVAAVLLLPTVSDLVSVLRLLTPGPRRLAATKGENPRFLFLVPAHNEELLLGSCLRSLQQLHYPSNSMDIVVIADNCHDRTAEIARSAGVRCLSRVAPDDPGKPRAISWALSQLAVSDYDGVVIVDADTEVDPDFATRMAAAAPLADKALQPYNDVANRSENALTRMAAVQSATNHGLAYVLKTRAGLNVPLSAGMCIGSGVLQTYGWNSDSLCEDWELYALLTERGVRIEGVPAARLYAQEAATLRASGSQRQRWTVGKLMVLAGHAWPLIRSRHIGVAQKLDVLAELSLPGPVVQLAIVVSTVALVALLRLPAASWLLAALLLSLVRPLLYTVLALARDPKPAQALRAFAFLPAYAAWRAWVLIGSIGALKGASWIRTERHQARPTARSNGAGARAL